MLLDIEGGGRTIYEPQSNSVSLFVGRIGIPGSGTDYAPFYLFAGIPVTYHKYDYDVREWGVLRSVGI